MFKSILNSESTLVQKIGNGNNQYTKNNGGKGKGVGGGGSSAIAALHKAHPNSGGTKNSDGTMTSLTNSGVGKVPHVHTALTDAGFTKASVNEYADGSSDHKYKHKDGSKASVREGAANPDSKHNKEGNHTWHVTSGSVKKAELVGNYVGVSVL